MIPDVLFLQMKELALETINPHLFTIATLTGHAVLAVGEKYAIGNKKIVCHICDVRVSKYGRNLLKPT